MPKTKETNPEQAIPASDELKSAAEETKRIWFDDVCNVCYMNGSCESRYGEPDKPTGKSNASDCPRHVFRNRKEGPKYGPMKGIISIPELHENIKAAYEIAKRPADAVEDIKLYSAYSIWEEFAGKKDVRANWFRLNREEPIGLYDELIQGFYDLEEEKQNQYSRMINELFTAEEIIEFAKSVNFTNATFGYEEISLPIGKDENDFSFEHRTNRRIGILKGNFMPLKNDSWRLPFPVWASFDLKRHKASEEVADKAHEMGKYFLHKYMT